MIPNPYIAKVAAEACAVPAGCGEWKRFYCPPRSRHNYGLLDRLSARDSYYLARSKERFARRQDAYLPAELPSGELGFVTGFRFIESPSISE
jgi:hypothetical protein